MAPKKRGAKSKQTGATKETSAPPLPFKAPPEVLLPFIEARDPGHVYLTHIDNKPTDLKRKTFMVPVLVNIVVVVFCVLRMKHILPYYFKILLSGFGRPNEETFNAEDSTWEELGWEIGKRGLTMFLDFLLVVFVWPWPVEFAFGITFGNPTRWRWNVGFRDQEIVVRRSREWTKNLKDIFKDENSKKILTAYINQATSPMLQEQKTGYLLMDGQWDLDWEAMVDAHYLVDKKDIALDAFRNVVVLHHEDYGWLCYDTKAGTSAAEDEKRRQVFKFRDALTSMGKENLFYRWVEIVQFEASRPGGFGPEKQEAAAKQIRELFEKDDIDFDELWKDTVGTESPNVNPTADTVD